jgi:hypothetical protein
VLAFVLVVMWSVYLGLWLRSRHERRSMSSISTFNKHLAVLGRTSPGGPIYGSGGPRPGVRAAPPAPPIAYAPLARGMTLTEARNRRRQVLTTLTAVASVTAAMAWFGGPFMVFLHVVTDLLLAGYLLLLVRARRMVLERRSKVVYLPQAMATPNVTAVPEAAYLRRSAN